jgi:hypothetical protein
VAANAAHSNSSFCIFAFFLDMQLFGALFVVAMACLQLICDDHALCKSAAECMASAFKSAGCSSPIQMASSSALLSHDSSVILCIIIVDPVSRASVAALHKELASFSPSDIAQRTCVICVNSNSFHLHSFPLSSLIALFASQSVPYFVCATTSPSDLQHAFSCVTAQFLPTISPHTSPNSQVRQPLHSPLRFPSLVTNALRRSSSSHLSPFIFQAFISSLFPTLLPKTTTS